MHDAASRVRELESRVRRWRVISAALATLTVFLGIVLVGQMTSGQRGITSTTPGPDASATADSSRSAIPDLARRDPDDPMALGAVDAPIVLIEWADYRCPYCAAFANHMLPSLIQEYIDTGLVRYEFNDVVFFGDDSFTGAVAGRAAAAQGRFHEFMTALYAAAPESGHPDLPRSTLIGFAEEAGAPDLERFTSDLDSAELHGAVSASAAYAQQLGVTSVPFFLVGDTAVAGAQPIETFRQLLDEQLAEAAG